MTSNDSLQHEPERLSDLLKRCRARIAPGCASLGPYLRVPGRVGRAVSQEEVAETAGISRQWYLMMETDRPARVSTTVLARIADVLMMDSVERAALFRLAVPELRSASLTDQSRGILEAYASLRRFMRPLWAATTEAEALTIVREHGMTQFAPDFMLTVIRTGDGRWEWAGSGSADDLARHASYQAMARGRWAEAFIDDLHCYTFMPQPGEQVTRSERDTRFPHVAAMEHPLLVANDWADISWSMVSIRSRAGHVARILAVHDTPHDFSDVQRAQLSALADLTSLALSGSASS